MLGLAGLIVCFLWFKLGSSSEYKGSNSTIDVTEAEAVEEEEEKEKKRVGIETASLRV